MGASQSMANLPGKLTDKKTRQAYHLGQSQASTNASVRQSLQVRPSTAASTTTSNVLSTMQQSQR